MKNDSTYLKTPHALRIKSIYLSQTHFKLPPEIARELGIPVNSVRNFIGAYLKHGRTNRKCGHQKEREPRRLHRNTMVLRLSQMFDEKDGS